MLFTSTHLLQINYWKNAMVGSWVEKKNERKKELNAHRWDVIIISSVLLFNLGENSMNTNEQVAYSHLHTILY